MRLLKKKPVLTKAKAKQSGEWSQARAHFEQLEPLKLGKLKLSTMTVPINRRPFLSTLAKVIGATYTTITLADGKNMLVLRYEL